MAEENVTLLPDKSQEMPQKELFFSAGEEYHYYPRGAVRVGDGARLFVKTKNVAELSLFIRPDGVEEGRLIPMTPCEEGFWLHLDNAAAGLYFASFVADGQRFFRQGGDGVGEEGVEWPILFYEQDFAIPSWVRGGVMYQIFPDRFAREGAILTDGVKNHRTIHKTVTERPLFVMDEPEYNATDFYGGNLAGVISRLSYLEELGVTVIYFNPVFEAASNHRYNTADYKKIDPMLGSEEDFRLLCRLAHERGMKVILDGVFSHTGSDSRYFNREGHYDDIGAYQSDESPYASWFSFGATREDYACWWNFKTLPNVNETDPNYMEFICGEDGVLRHWLRAGADGWRLDVVDELPDEFLEAVRSAVKAENKEALLIGEVWEDAALKESYGSRRKFLQGAQMDVTMNYPFRSALIDGYLQRNAKIVAGGVRSVLEHYPAPAMAGMMNMLSTHDTWRILNVLALERSVTREQELFTTLTPLEEARGDHRLRRLAMLQYFLPGMPSIYYGDEVGMSGCGDPWNRRFFPWERSSCPLHDHFVALGRLRSGRRELFGGDFYIWAPDEGRLEMRWKKAGQELALTANFGEKPALLPEYASFVMLEGSVECTSEGCSLGADSVVIWEYR